MPAEGLFDRLTLWQWFAATVAAIMLAVEAGYRFGKYRRSRSDQEKEGPVGAIVGASLALTGFFMAFTFGLAASRFNDRREVLLQEANAIGTAYLRVALLPNIERDYLRAKLREYVDVRLDAVQAGRLEAAIQRSEELHALIWEKAAAYAEKHPDSVMAGLFITSLNEVIDLHSKRLMVGLRSRVPGAIWLVLYLVSLVTMAEMGFHAGLSGTTRSVVVLGLILMFSTVLVLIADLDRGHKGLLQVSQQAMIDLKKSIAAP